MALILLSDVIEAQNAQGFNFYSLTGAYAVLLNEGGWGSPNVDTTDVNVDGLEIIFPDSVSLYATGTTVNIDLIPLGFPTTDKTFYTTILASLFSLSNFIDGQYKFTRTVEGGTYPDEFSYTWTEYIIFYQNVMCCTSKLDLKAKVNCGCNDDPNSIILDKILYLNALQAAIVCGDQDAAIRFLKALQSICAKNGCTGCPPSPAVTTPIVLQQ